MERVHPAAAGFGQAAPAYERGRPSYPHSAVQLVVEKLGILPSSTVVDLAAGTGKLTRQLLVFGCRVVAVEPVEGMRRALTAAVPGVDVLEGTAESIPLPDGAVDAVTVGQAFHWFQGEEALREIHRVLRPGGGLALLWNRRDLSQPVQQGIEAIVSPYRHDAPAHRSGRWRDAFERTTLFTPLEERQIPSRHAMDRDRLVDRVMSTSFIAALPSGEREAVLERARALAASQPERFDLDYVADVYWCYARAGTRKEIVP